MNIESGARQIFILIGRFVLFVQIRVRGFTFETRIFVLMRNGRELFPFLFSESLNVLYFILYLIIVSDVIFYYLFAAIG